MNILFGAFSIYLFYCLYSVFQEQVTHGKFGGERFTQVFFLLWVTVGVNGVFALALHLLRDSKRTPIVQLLRWSLPMTVTYIVAMLTSNYALLFVSYPTQVLVKSSKPIPVMLIDKLVFQRHYSLSKWLAVLLICFGVGLFLYDPRRASNGGGGSGEPISSWSSLLGPGLLLVSLACDGITGPLQSYVMRHVKPTDFELMFAINLGSFVLLTPLVIWSRDLAIGLAMCSRHLELPMYIALFSVCSALGQTFIYAIVRSSGPLLLSVVTTTRKFFTILLSVLIFGNILAPLQWFSVFLVFLGLGWTVYIESSQKAGMHHLHRSPSIAPNSSDLNQKLDNKQD